MSNLMKKKGDKKLLHQSIASGIGLGVSAVLLMMVFILTLTYLEKLENTLVPMLESMEKAVNDEDFEKVNAMSKDVLNLLSDAEQRLQLFSSHYDIEQLMNAARLLVRIGTEGDVAAYMTGITNIRSWVGFIRENNRLTLGIII